MLQTKKVIALVSTMVLVLSGCTSSKTDYYKLSEKHKIIFDTDTAGDDAMAIILAAKASNVELEGVTVLAGNVSLEQGCQNALMSLEVAGKEDVPVYKGSDTKFSGKVIEPHSVFGEDGMGDLDIIHPSGTAQKEDAVDFIIDTVKANPDEIEIMATGPLTNIAKAIKKDPDTMKKVKRIWSMGTGGINCAGDANAVAEFNVYQDMSAYQYVLDSGIEMTIVGYDMCKENDVCISASDLETFSKSGECGEFLSKALSSFVKNYADDEGYAHVCDPVAVASLIWSDFIKDSDLCDGDVLQQDCDAIGEVLFYQKGMKYDMIKKEFDYHVDVVTGLNSESYIENVCHLIK